MADVEGEKSTVTLNRVVRGSFTEGENLHTLKG